MKRQKMERPKSADVPISANKQILDRILERRRIMIEQNALRLEIGALLLEPTSDSEIPEEPRLRRYHATFSAAVKNHEEYLSAKEEKPKAEEVTDEIPEEIEIEPESPKMGKS